MGGRPRPTPARPRACLRRPPAGRDALYSRSRAPPDVCNPVLQPTGALAPQRVPETLAEEAPVSDAKRADVRRPEMPVLDGRVAEKGKQPLDGGPWSEAVVAEAVGA